MYNNSHKKEKDKKVDFIKADDGKLHWSLLPFEQLEQVVKVLTEGAKKYSPDNWKNVMMLNDMKTLCYDTLPLTRKVIKLIKRSVVVILLTQYVIVCF